MRDMLPDLDVIRAEAQRAVDNGLVVLAGWGLDAEDVLALLDYIAALEGEVKALEDVSPFLPRLRQIGAVILARHPEYNELTLGELWDLLTVKLLETLER